MDFIKLDHHFVAGRRTRLCRWIVYSRATTSLMAERLEPCFFDVVLGVVEDFSLGAILVG